MKDKNKLVQPNRRVLTSKNSPELKKKMLAISMELIKRNHELYKRLENR